MSVRYLIGHHAGLAGDVEPSVSSREGDAVDERVCGQIVSDLATAAGDHIDQARRQPCRGKTLRWQRRREGGGEVQWMAQVRRWRRHWVPARMQAVL